MGVITGTKRELLYSSTISGQTASVPLLTEYPLMTGLPPILIPAGYFYSNYIGKSLSMKCVGRWTPNGVNCSFNVRFLPTPVLDKSQGILFPSRSQALNAGVTSALFFWTVDFVLQNVGIGPTSTLAAMGEIHSPNGYNGSFGFMCPVPDANTPIVQNTFNAEIDNYMFLSVSNTNGVAAITSVGVEMIKVWGEN